VTAHNTI